ncbi:transcriptional regulator, partial [Azospirillum sp. TSO5]
TADVFDPLPPPRPYKRSWTLEEARAYLVQNRGLHFDPSLLDAFLSRWDDVCRIHHENADELPALIPEEA